jgi:hypothetical protein
MTPTTHTISTKSALAPVISAGIACLLVAIGPVVEPATSFSQTYAAARRCAWQVDPHRFRGDPFGVTAINRRNVWAVGITDDYQPLALHWLGAGWRRVNVPKKQGPDLLFAAVFATANDGWAVGRGEPGDAIAHWDGRRWTIVPGADLGDSPVSLMDVAALRKDDAWAVGLQSNPGQVLVEHWDGSRWEVVPTPEVGQSELLAVEAISHNNVWAVGNQTNKTLIEHWDGRRWKVMPNPAAPRGLLRDIAAVSARDIWVVGDYGPSDAYFSRQLRTLVQHWDGTNWRIVSLPIRRGSLESVAAISSRDIWVSGGSIDRGTILAHRLGTTWRVVQTPRIKGQERLLIAAAGRDDIWATTRPSSRVVLEHYSCRS